MKKLSHLLILTTLILTLTACSEAGTLVVNTNQCRDVELAKPNINQIVAPENNVPEPVSDLYPVTKVVDGDTIDVNIDGTVERIRLIGIDTPEIVDPRKPVECFGLEASNKAKAVLTGQQVRLEKDNSQANRDVYNRLLRYVFLADGINFNKMMIEQGYAYEYTYDLPYKYQTEFKQAQKYAQDNKLGLWQDNVCPGTTLK